MFIKKIKQFFRKEEERKPQPKVSAKIPTYFPSLMNTMGMSEKEAITALLLEFNITTVSDFCNELEKGYNLFLFMDAIRAIEEMQKDNQLIFDRDNDIMKLTDSFRLTISKHIPKPDYILVMG